MTVSRVLRGEGESQFHDQVMAAVRDLEYVPVRASRQNGHVRTRCLGVLLDGEFVFDSLVGLRTFSGLSKAAFEGGHDLLLLQPKGHRPLEEQKMQVLDRRCDGFIFVVPHERSEVLELLVKNKYPVVTCYSTHVPDGVYSVVPDNSTAIRQAVELLYKQGHQNIAMWSGHHGHSDAQERTLAYEETMFSLGLGASARDFPVSFTALSLSMQARKILDTVVAHNITAVICHNDERALHLWDAAIDRGLRIPEDLSLIGVDDTAEGAQRGLTTFTNPFRTIGREAVATILGLLHGSVPSNPCKRIEMPLVERKSIAPPKQRSQET
jgi:LacI family transcriptional regulator